MTTTTWSKKKNSKQKQILQKTNNCPIELFNMFKNWIVDVALHLNQIRLIWYNCFSFLNWSKIIWSCWFHSFFLNCCWMLSKSTMPKYMWLSQKFSTTRFTLAFNISWSIWCWKQNKSHKMILHCLVSRNSSLSSAVVVLRIYISGNVTICFWCFVRENQDVIYQYLHYIHIANS